MNERIRELAINSGLLDAKYSPDFQSIYNSQLEKFAELIVKECADIARNTNLEDVEGGDSAVLCAAKYNILDHFGVES